MRATIIKKITIINKYIKYKRMNLLENKKNSLIKAISLPVEN